MGCVRATVNTHLPGVAVCFYVSGLMRDADIGVWVAERIGALRTKAGLSLRELARRSGLGAEVVSRAERGLQTPSVQTLERVCSGLGVSLSEFFGDGAMTGASVVELQRLAGLLAPLGQDSRRDALKAFELLARALRNSATASPTKGVLRAASRRARPMK
jgi:transcriptional regulator with XRE-family HTH domain